MCQGTCLRTRIVSSSRVAECLYSAWLLSDDLQCGSACQHDEQVPELCVHWRGPRSIILILMSSMCLTKKTCHMTLRNLPKTCFECTVIHREVDVLRARVKHNHHASPVPCNQVHLFFFCFTLKSESFPSSSNRREPHDHALCRHFTSIGLPSTFFHNRTNPVDS